VIGLPHFREIDSTVGDGNEWAERRATVVAAEARAASPNGSARSLPKWTEQAIIPGYHAASLPSVSRRFVWGERAV